MHQRRFLLGVCLSPLLIAAQSPLVMTKPGQDLSAYRFDCDVFGWNRDFSEVGAVGTEVTRGPKGKHRGQAFLLAYKVGETIPIYNVITHNITHADLPQDPLPLDDARDLLWVIETQYKEMWSQKPLRREPHGGMKVEPLWDPMESDESADCTPGVAFILDYRGQRRMQPYQPLDMQANCHLLDNSDTRIYWGRKDIAAAMIRFDFSPRRDNEESARFVVSASWNLAQSMRLRVDIAGPMNPDARAHINSALRPYGTVNFRPIPNETSNGAELNRIQIKTAWLPLGRRLAKELKAPLADVMPDDTLPVDVVLHYGKAAPPREVVAPTPAPDPNTSKAKVMAGPKKPTAPVQDGDPILPSDDAPPPVDDPTVAPSPHKAAPNSPPPTYLKDWQVR